MHDPMTVAFEIDYPWYKYRPGVNPMWKNGYRESAITIWHNDPERDGSDDSCGWSYPHLNEAEKKLVNSLVENEVDNLLNWFPNCDKDEARYRIHRIFRIHKRLVRPWWRHPKWHFWHWKIQVHCFEKLKRWLFSKCCVCGKRFSWGYCPSATWNSDGPRWFIGEKGVHHHECERIQCDPNIR